MSARLFTGILLRLQHAATEEQAAELLAQIADPFTRRIAQREWDELRSQTCKEIA